jgi:TolB-like protein
MSGDPEQEYFADGMVEDIITALSRYKMLFVIARNSSFTYKGSAVDIKQVGRELGVRYVLEGSVRKAANRLRITGQLIDATSGMHIWADKFDGPMEDVFDLQDKVASNVAGIIYPALQEAEIRLAADRPMTDLSAYDLYLRAVPLMKAWAQEPVRQALDLADQAIGHDPNYGPALSMAAFCRSQLIWSGWADTDSDAVRLRGIELGRCAIAAAPDDSETVSLAAGALMNFGEDINVLKGVIDNVLARNPSSTMGWFWSGWIRTFAGEFDLAIQHFDKSLRLDPRTTRLAFHRTGIGICHFYNRQFDQAIAMLEASLHEVPDYPTTSRFLCACYVQMGRLADARDIAVRHNILKGESWLKVGAFIRSGVHRAILFDSLKRVTDESE